MLCEETVLYIFSLDKTWAS